MALQSMHPFNKELYHKCNTPSFEVLCQNFKLLYPVLRPEDYGIDVSVYISDKAFHSGSEPIAKIELEVKGHWTEYNFPFNDIQCLAKKQKHARQPVCTYWVLFNRNLTNCGIVPFSKILVSELSVIKCRNKYDDFFYKVLKSDFVWGLEHIERYIIFKAFESANQSYKNLFNNH